MKSEESSNIRGPTIVDLASVVAPEQEVIAPTERSEALEEFALSNAMPDPRGIEFGAMNLLQVLLAMESHVVTLKKDPPNTGSNSGRHHRQQAKDSDGHEQKRQDSRRKLML